MLKLGDWFSGFLCSLFYFPKLHLARISDSCVLSAHLPMSNLAQVIILAQQIIA